MKQQNEGFQLDVPGTGRLPWPGDAIMIIASLAGQENRAAMESVFAATCHMCDSDLHADTRTVRTAMQLPARRGRPVNFFCVACALKHDRKSVGLLIDQRDGRDEHIRQELA